MIDSLTYSIALADFDKYRRIAYPNYPKNGKWAWLTSDWAVVVCEWSIVVVIIQQIALRHRGNNAVLVYIKSDVHNLQCLFANLKRTGNLCIADPSGPSGCVAVIFLPVE